MSKPALPSSGGSYTRNDDGSIGKTETAKPKKTAPKKPVEKEG